MRALTFAFAYSAAALLFLGIGQLRAAERAESALVNDDPALPRPVPMRFTVVQLERPPLHVGRALSYGWVAERPLGSNAGEPIDTWRRRLGIDEPVPWCGIFASVVAEEGRVVAPRVFSSQARDFAVRGHARKLADVIYGRYTPKAGDYRVKTRRGGNHVDIFLSWDPVEQKGRVIGGNVSHRVKVREVTLRSMIFDGTTHITDVDGFYAY